MAAYLNGTVMPALRTALRRLVRTRPTDPFQYLADYLVTHKPSAVAGKVAAKGKAPDSAAGVAAGARAA